MSKQKTSKAAEEEPAKDSTTESTPPGDSDQGEPKYKRMQAPEASPTESDGEGNDQTEASKTEQQEEAGKVFSQEELDKILDDRLKRERKKFSDYKKLKAKAAQLDEVEKEKLTEVERLKVELEEAQTAQAEAQQQARRQLINNAVLTEISNFATGDGFGFRKDALGAALKLVDLSEIEVDGGEVAGVTDAVKALAKENEFLIEQAKKTTPGSPTNPAKTSPTGRSDADRRQDYFGGGGGAGKDWTEGNLILPE